MLNGATEQMIIRVRVKIGHLLKLAAPQKLCSCAQGCERIV